MRGCPHVRPPHPDARRSARARPARRPHAVACRRGARRERCACHGAARLGPPWISIEYPVNPYDATTKGAFLVVHAFHHGTPTAFPVSGTARGDRERRAAQSSRSASPPRRAPAPSPSPGSGLTKAPGRCWSSRWRRGPRTASRPSSTWRRTGEVAAIRVPTRQHDGHTLPAAVAMSEVEASLRQRAAQLLGGARGVAGAGRDRRFHACAPP